MKSYLCAALLLVLLPIHPVFALHPTPVTDEPQYLQPGYEYMLKPDQSMIVSVIKVHAKWHVILVEGEEYCPSFSNVLDPEDHISSVCDTIRFYIDRTGSGDTGVFVVLD
jgi:hypothetical protein